MPMCFVTGPLRAVAYSTRGGVCHHHTPHFASRSVHRRGEAQATSCFAGHVHCGGGGDARSTYGFGVVCRVQEFGPVYLARQRENDCSGRDCEDCANRFLKITIKRET